MRLLAVAPVRSSNWLLVYGAAIIGGEVAVISVGSAPGAAVHAIVLGALATHGAFEAVPKDPRLLVLALLPLTRLMSLVMPTQLLPAETWVFLVLVPVALSGLLVARAIGMTAVQIGLGIPAAPLRSAVLVLSSIPLAFVVPDIVRAQLELLGEPSPGLAVASIVGIVVVEEGIFRGLLQRVAAARGTNLSILIPSLLYAAMYLPAGGATALIMGAVGLTFSTAIAAGASLWATIGAHLIMRLLMQFGG